MIHSNNLGYSSTLDTAPLGQIKSCEDVEIAALRAELEKARAKKPDPLRTDRRATTVGVRRPSKEQEHVEFDT